MSHNANIIAIWGCGYYCKEMLGKYPQFRGNNILYVDTNPLKWGTYINGKIINSPLKLLMENIERILIASENKNIMCGVRECVSNLGLKVVVESASDYIHRENYTVDNVCIDNDMMLKLVPWRLVFDSLQDDESKILYNGLIRSYRKGRVGQIYRELLQIDRRNGTFKISEPYKCLVEKDRLSLLKRFKNKYDNEKLILVGMEEQTEELIIETGVEIFAYIDLDKYTCKYIDSKSLRKITPEEAVKKYPDAFFVSGKKCDGAIRTKLLDLGLSPEKFFMRHTCWRQQYFDESFLKPDRYGIFVDAGAFDLNNTFDYIKWCDNNFEKVYAFEPDEVCYDSCKKRLNKSMFKNKIELIHAATWSSDKELQVDNYCRDGVAKVPARSIDSVLAGEKVTYIKMDVEGAELEALKGAKMTIKKWRPRLAICIYHKLEDCWMLPLYILSLVPDYQMYIRHYSTCTAETVLYCI